MDWVLRQFKTEVKKKEDIIKLNELFRSLTIYSLKVNNDLLFMEYGNNLNATVSNIKDFLIKDYSKKLKKEFTDKRTQLVANIEKFDEFVLNGALKPYKLDFVDNSVSNKSLPNKNDLIRKLIFAFFDLAFVQDICLEASTQEGQWIFYTIVKYLKQLKTTSKNHINQMKNDKNFDIDKIPYIGTFYFWTRFD